MQIIVPWQRGQVKPWGSLPRINPDHPLAKGLVTYMYDAGGGVVFDLVTGKRCTVTTLGSLTNTPTPTTSRFGSVWNTNGGQTGGGGNAWAVIGGNSPGLDAVTNAAPYSAVTGYMRRGSPASGTNYGTLFTYTDALTNTPFWIALDPSNQPNYFMSGVALRVFAFAPPINGFATTGIVLTTSTSGTGYHIDATNGFNSQTNTEALATFPGTFPAFYNEGLGGSDPAFNGSIFYGAVWKLRALTASEIANLHQDPWGLLIYPEDEMFATLVGVVAADTLWAQTWL